MNILPKKSWHVRNKDNIARVRRDESQAAQEQREIQQRVERAEQEARTEYLRKKAQAALQQTGKGTEDGETAETSRGAQEIEHLNLFPLEDSSEKKGNAEYLKEKKEEKEKQERAIGLLVSLGPAPGTEATPWYMKCGKEKEEDRDKKEKGKNKPRSITEEEKEKKDRKLKDGLDPLKEMKKALAVKDGKEKKHKKKEKKDRGEKRSGESSVERLRAERLQREAEERKRTQALLDQRSGGGKEKEQEREMGDRDRPYNSAYFPELARKRQRKDRDQYGFY
ncbi:leukocyte receptor cluster member 1 homolog isoform X2 [Sinocyclocheilus grahami]|uniref:Leukocyte receptor cluster member 1 homolog n=1 Tax=Sinocyclocheilus grahami TaxID=75366 RepID=A0A672LM66_SINGR|nr:PREDICTED: leukocyte receptor cluster member 1 homolog isoform X1 [Sinocyclocheilus grahami]XP_016090327.1 PREDICTED: leukocyte receptor cluster member 1 homolog isoform X2 [Sinocyclocheilus grahami]